MPGGKPQQMWAPEGLTALRANREEFPIEATISPFESAGQCYYTIILRDINDRRRTEAQLNRLQWGRAYLQDEVKSAYNFEDIVGQAPAMKRLFASIEQVAPSDSTVLLMGETGTGKELIAHAIHNVSLRKDKLLVKLNCAALPSELIESELFGHEKGAFTGATAQRKGRFELADGGTLFLDEVGELSLPA
jgi:formate hydrogenlyase transcriptional activator